MKQLILDDSLSLLSSEHANEHGKSQRIRLKLMRGSCVVGGPYNYKANEKPLFVSRVCVEKLTVDRLQKKFLQIFFQI